jgi:hypothetical protein
VSNVNLPNKLVPDGRLKKSLASPNYEDDFQVWIKENARNVRSVSKCLTEEAVIEVRTCFFLGV